MERYGNLGINGIHYLNIPFLNLVNLNIETHLKSTSVKNCRVLGRC